MEDAKTRKLELVKRIKELQAEKGLLAKEERAAGGGYKEVKATLEMARLMVSSGRSPLPTAPQRLLAVFQPHRYSRTQQFLDDFAQALQNCDLLLLAPVYAAGEQPLQGICSNALAERVRNLKPDLQIAVAETLDELTDLVIQHSREQDLVLAMGAGDVNGLWSRLTS